MAFWSDPNTEPKISMRFNAYVNNIEFWSVEKIDRPSYTINNKEIKYLNHTFNYPTTAKWNPIEMVIRDNLSINGAQRIQELMRSSGYVFPENANITETISKKKAVSALGALMIEVLGPDEDEVIETWLFKNAWISDIKWGEHSHESDDIVKITLTIVYDFAKLNPPEITNR